MVVEVSFFFTKKPTNGIALLETKFAVEIKILNE